MNKNKVFQWLWYRIIKFIVPCVGNGIVAHYWRFRVQFALSKLFGGAHRILIGDSNSAIFGSYGIMKMFKKLTLAWGVSGMTADDWVDFFKTKKGLKILDLIHGKEIIWNIGGNNCLRSQMPTVRDKLTTLFLLTPTSWACTIPPVHYWLIAKLYELAKIHKTDAQIREEITTINNYIRRTWHLKVFDYAKLFLDPQTGEVYPWALRDVVHFSDIALKIITPIEDAI